MIINKINLIINLLKKLNSNNLKVKIYNTLVLEIILLYLNLQ
jgi:hypothetical protein